MGLNDPYKAGRSSSEAACALLKKGGGAAWGSTMTSANKAVQIIVRWTIYD